MRGDGNIAKESITYTFPNTTSFSKRGGLEERVEALKSINESINKNVFKTVEIPADFIKNKTEEKKTGLEVCSMLDNESVKKIYSSDNGSIDEVQYILHTEPVFSRKGENKSCVSHLKWYNPEWINKFLAHVFSIIDYFKQTPYAIEIHPGMSKRGYNNIRTFSKAIDILHQKYFDKYNQEVFIFIENRTNQHIQDGSDIKDFWYYFKDKYPHLIDKTGIILDIQQLYTSTKKSNRNFQSEFSQIPDECLFGVHVHERHRKPSCRFIPREIWQYIGDNQNWTSQKARGFHILPEVHHSNDVEYTYNFCKDFLNLK